MSVVNQVGVLSSFVHSILKRVLKCGHPLGVWGGDQKGRKDKKRTYRHSDGEDVCMS